MKLKTALSKIPYCANIRIFAGPQTIFNGNRSAMHETELNIRIRPYYECEVIGTHVNNGHFVMAI